jgi:hypothetical protein
MVLFIARKVLCFRLPDAINFTAMYVPVAMLQCRSRKTSEYKLDTMLSRSTEKKMPMRKKHPPERRFSFVELVEYLPTHYAPRFGFLSKILDVQTSKATSLANKDPRQYLSIVSRLSQNALLLVHGLGFYPVVNRQKVYIQFNMS